MSDVVIETPTYEDLQADDWIEYTVDHQGANRPAAGRVWAGPVGWHAGTDQLRAANVTLLRLTRPRPPLPDTVGSVVDAWIGDDVHTIALDREGRWWRVLSGLPVRSDEVARWEPRLTRSEWTAGR